MSVANELKSIDDVLRAKLNRRDRLAKHVRKHKANIIHLGNKITKKQKALDVLTESTYSSVEGWTDDVETEQATLKRAEALLADANKEVAVRLEELGLD